MRLILIFILFSLIACSTKKESKQPTDANKSKADLVADLETIWKTEQEPIQIRDSIGRVFGFESEEFNKQQEICHKNHAINEKKIIEILDNQGWPDEQIIGEQGSLTICNVLQHSKPEIRLKYLPMMKEAVKMRKLQPRLLARAEDRIATDRGELQIYGDQMKYYPETKSFNVWPVYDPTNIDKRRAEIGLGPIAEHLKNRFDFEWDIEEQIKRTEEFKRNKNIEKK